ncbi:MAG: hypothetical protein M1815_005550 [Lichina confinis]|nr:MAG: hypothetical protein M1815_005550 [Lichina confinis]
MLLIGLTGSIATGKSTVSSILSRAPYNLPVVDADALAREVVEPGTTAYRQIIEYFGDSTPDLLQPVSSAKPGSVSGAQARDVDREDDDGPARETSARPLNRAALGQRVFGTDAARAHDRAVLNRIVHPAVRRAMYRAVAREYLRGRHWAVVLDVPLLFESGLDVACGSVVVVGVRDRAVQMRRLLARDPALSEEDARRRVLSQTDVRDKARRAERRDECWGLGLSLLGLRRRWRRRSGRPDPSSSPGDGPAAGIVLWNDADKDDLERQVRAMVDHLRATSPPWWHTLLWICPPLALVVGVYSSYCSWRAKRAWEREVKQR